jgi:hypothetical protein
MRFEISCTAAKSARVWVRELPDASYPSSGIVRKSIPALADGQIFNPVAAVEILVPMGARAYYGLLGGRFEPVDSGGLDVEVVLSESNGPKFPSTTSVAYFDTPRIGLPEEFATGVLAGLVGENPAVAGMPGGRLKFDVAAFGWVGSSHNVFRHLARLVVSVMTADLGSDPTSRLKALIDRPIH